MTPSVPEGGDYQLQLASRSTGVPLVVSMEFASLDGATYALPYLELKSLRAGSNEVLITNDHQPIPFKFRFRMGSDLHATEDWSVQLAGVGVRWLDELRRFRKATSVGSTGIVRDLKTGREFRSVVTSANAGEQFTPEFDEFIDRVLAIQKATNAEVLIPHRSYPTEEDLNALVEIEHALTHNELPPDFEFSARFPDSAEGRESCNRVLSGGSFEAELNSYSISILDSVVELGALHLSCENASIDARDRELAQQFVVGLRSGSVQLRISSVPPAHFQTQLKGRHQT